MEETPVTGANETPAAAPAGPADALTSPVNDGFNHIDPSVDLISDVDGRSAKGGEVKPAVTTETKADDAKAAAEKEAAEKAAAEKAENERFDKHPRFQELIKERDTFKQELAEIKGQLKILTPQDKKDAEDREEKALPYKDITKMSKEEVLEWQEDDPVGYAANLYQQFVHESREQLRAEQAEARQTSSVKETYAAYVKENPDFPAKWNSGEINEYMKAHPGHNAISAHMAMTAAEKGKSEQTRIDEAVAKAVKEAEERVRRNFQAKRNAEVISDGGTVVPSKVDDELKNPEKYGGATTVGALRLARMRQQAAGG